MGTIGGSHRQHARRPTTRGRDRLGATIVTSKRKIERISSRPVRNRARAGGADQPRLVSGPEAAAYMKFNNPASRFAIVGVFVRRLWRQVRVGVTGAGPCAFRQADMRRARGKVRAQSSPASR